jgi:hypothetical protein
VSSGAEWGEKAVPGPVLLKVKRMAFARLTAPGYMFG